MEYGDLTWSITFFDIIKKANVEKCGGCCGFSEDRRLTGGDGRGRGGRKTNKSDEEREKVGVFESFFDK